MPITQRRVTAAKEMRALAHPVRLQLLELLGSEGAFTASEAARRLDETPANVSWHLRKLASYGFVRQGEGRGRAKPWKFVAQSLTFGDDAEDPTVATALTDLFIEREFHVLRTSIRQQPAEEPAWRDATAVLQTRYWLTQAEAAALGSRLKEIFMSEDLDNRNQDPSLRPPGARLMALMSWVVPYGDQPQEATEGITA
jgi:DNA-binding transcriptional ArsR family regulator